MTVAAPLRSPPRGLFRREFERIAGPRAAYEHEESHGHQMPGRADP